MKLITWNVNGIRKRQGELQELIAAEQPDVLCAQEIKAAPDQVPALLVAGDEYHCYWHGAGGYSGVAVLVACRAVDGRPAFTHPEFDHEERIVVADLGRLVIASVYVPNGGKDYPAKLRFLESLIAWSGDLVRSGRRVLITGDLNVAREDRDIHPRERKPNQIGARAEERALFAELLGRGLVDIGRALEPENDNLFTWWAPWRNLRARNIGWRIDYVLADHTLAAGATAAVSRRDFGTSDHAPVVVTFGSTAD